MTHPFDRYAGFTDVATLKEYSEKPLRKCVRVNTLKMRVEDFKQYAEKKNWSLEPVPWCNEGFFIDREDRSKALGKDLLHILGYIYMQEASSMLPPALLQPQPGESILDMAAAPGSKSTQIAAALKGQGLVVCNDMQPARINTLITALNRLGVINAIVTKKMGQWFGKNMTGRFHRVLIDAPCTGQGTSRKDPGALKYCSEHSIGKNAKLQRELLEAAVHATGIGGTVAYSTCTLTPEENEDVVLSILSKFPTQLEVVDPRKIGDWENWDMEPAIKDSIVVQESLYPQSTTRYPFLRIWPQTYNSEGFFCALLKKTAPTLEAAKPDLVPRKDELLPKARVKGICEFLESRFGQSFKQDNEVLLQNGQRLWIASEAAVKFKLPAPYMQMGLPFGKLLTKSPLMLDHDMTSLRGAVSTENVIDISDAELTDLLSGKDVACSADLLGHVLLRYNGMCIGRARAKDGIAKNQLPRWMVQMYA